MMLNVFSASIKQKWIIDINKLIQKFKRELPDYMLPKHYSVLKEFPLTPNGKIDYQSLSKVELPAQKYIAPRNQLETTICSMYAEILGLSINQVGVEHDFSMLGGNSI